MNKEVMVKNIRWLLVVLTAFLLILSFVLYTLLTNAENHIDKTVSFDKLYSQAEEKIKNRCVEQNNAEVCSTLHLVDLSKLQADELKVYVFTFSNSSKYDSKTLVYEYLVHFNGHEVEIKNVGSNDTTWIPLKKRSERNTHLD